MIIFIIIILTLIVKLLYCIVNNLVVAARLAQDVQYKQVNNLYNYPTNQNGASLSIQALDYYYTAALKIYDARWKPENIK